MTNYEKVAEGVAATGKTELLRYLDGKTLTREEAILAMCYDCTGCYAEGKRDCKLPECPLYQYMPYRGRNGDEK